MLSDLSGHITKNSEKIFEHKLGQILRAKKEEDFDAILNELQFAYALTERVRPIAFSPLVPEELVNSENEPPSPDFAIRLPSKDVLIEATVLNFAVFTDWDRSVLQLTELIGQAIKRKGISRIVNFYVPLSFRIPSVPKSALRMAIEKILDRESGELKLDVLGKNLIAIWQPLPHIDTKGEMPTTRPPGIKCATFGPIGSPPSFGLLFEPSIMTDSESNLSFVGPTAKRGPGGAFAFETRPLNEEVNDLLLKSLRNTLKRKREQFPLEAPYILAIKLGHHRISQDLLSNILVERIWPNPEHAWISGICLFKPGILSDVIDMPGSRIHYTPSSLNLYINPNTRNILPNELIALFEGKTTYIAE